MQGTASVGAATGDQPRPMERRPRAALRTSCEQISETGPERYHRKYLIAPVSFLITAIIVHFGDVSGGRTRGRESHPRPV
ncbi:MAG: hypothetical protein ACQESR_18150 [Planctomycetota bacterium]